MKKRRNLATLAVLGISAGLFAAGCHQSTNKGSADQGGTTYEQLSPDMQAFYNSLSPDAQRKFMDLDAQHRKMAMDMLNQTGVGQNGCKGLGGCKNNLHDCAGKNSCKGQGGPAIQDPNKAVDVQYQSQQRGQTNYGSQDQMNPQGQQAPQSKY